MNLDTDARERLAGEVGLFGFDEGDDAVLGGMDGEIAGDVGPLASNLRGASLTDDDFAVFDSLATKTLHAETLAGVIMDIFGGTACFDM